MRQAVEKEKTINNSKENKVKAKDNGLCGQRRAETKVYSMRKCKTIERTRRSTKEWTKKKTETNECSLGAGTPVVAGKGGGL
jgi:hypothetical protein